MDALVKGRQKISIKIKAFPLNYFEKSYLKYDIYIYIYLNKTPVDQYFNGNH